MWEEGGVRGMNGTETLVVFSPLRGTAYADEQSWVVGAWKEVVKAALL